MLKLNISYNIYFFLLRISTTGGFFFSNSSILKNTCGKKNKKIERKKRKAVSWPGMWTLSLKLKESVKALNKLCKLLLLFRWILMLYILSLVLGQALLLAPPSFPSQAAATTILSIAFINTFSLSHLFAFFLYHFSSLTHILILFIIFYFKLYSLFVYFTHFSL